MGLAGASRGSPLRDRYLQGARTQLDLVQAERRILRQGFAHLRTSKRMPRFTYTYAQAALRLDAGKPLDGGPSDNMKNRSMGDVEEEQVTKCFERKLSSRKLPPGPAREVSS